MNCSIEWLSAMLAKIKTYFSIEKHQTVLVYAWIFFLCYLCYGILIPALGFYWDDLPILLKYPTFGAAGFPEFLASDRPFSAWNFMLTTSLFHFNPLGYHILAFVLRVLSVILFYQIFRVVWPEKIRTAAIAASSSENVRAASCCAPRISLRDEI